MISLTILFWFLAMALALSAGILFLWFMAEASSPVPDRGTAFGVCLILWWVALFVTIYFAAKA